MATNRTALTPAVEHRRVRDADILESYANGVTMGELAARWSCSESTVRRVLHDNGKLRKKRRGRPRGLTPERADRVWKIAKEIQKGASPTALAAKYKISRMQVYHDKRAAEEQGWLEASN